MAVDQSSGERRRFELRAYIDEVLLSFFTTKRNVGGSIQVRSEPDRGVEFLIDCPAVAPPPPSSGTE